MNTVIVPVDFSDASLNAAQYAAQLLNDHENINMILYHAYDKDWESESSEEKLSELKTRFDKNYKLNITISAEKDNFITGLEKLVRHKRADLVIMSNTGHSSIAQVFMGSNTLKMSETKACPVLIVPVNSQYHEVKNVMLASDFKNARNTTPSAPIKDFLNTFKANLRIVNVNSEHYVAITEEFEKQKEDLENMFAEFNPEFYFVRFYDVNDALNQFATDKNIDLIITIHKQHSLLYRRFRSIHIKNLKNNSSVPVLVVHE
jgi:nucleotide-binding universal stress UspA family protein